MKLKTKMETVEFGSYEWLVLEKQDGKMLILKNQTMPVQGYHEFGDDSCTWADNCTRAYLNEEFYDDFDDDEKERILTTEINHPINPFYDGDSEESTEDKIFLLSFEEVLKYFGGNETLEKALKEDNKEIDDEYNEARIAEDEEDGRNNNWWTRSYGCDSEDEEGFKNVVYVNEKGILNMEGESPWSDGYLRPAMWIKTEE